MRPLKPEPLTEDAFAPFGDVLSAATARERREINYGNATRHHDLARLDFGDGGGTPLVSLFRAKPLPRPIAVRVMERHPLSSQAFFPLDPHPFLVVVAPAGAFDAGALRAFVAGPGQGVNYRRGTWHHFIIALDAPRDFLVIDRGGPEPNCDEVHLDAASARLIDY